MWVVKNKSRDTEKFPNGLVSVGEFVLSLCVFKITMAKSHQAYPQYALSACMKLVEYVRAFNGQVNSNELAEFLHRTNSGSFRVLINACVKHGLLQYENYVITLTALGREILETQEPYEKRQLMIHAFLKPPVYAELVKRWGDDINERNIEGVLQSWDVDKAHLVKRNFIRDANSLGLLSKTGGTLAGGLRDSDLLEKELDKVPIPRDENVESTEAITKEDETVDNQSEQKPMENILKTFAPNSEVDKPNQQNASSSEPEQPLTKMKILLSGQRYAELTSSSKLTIKDYEILKMQLDTWKLHQESI